MTTRKHGTHKIIFTKGGKIVQTWDGYFSYAEARAAVRDADLTIPLSWDWKITTT